MKKKFNEKLNYDARNADILFLGYFREDFLKNSTINEENSRHLLLDDEYLNYSFSVHLKNCLYHSHYLICLFMHDAIFFI